ncbi:MAG: START domain-containing protein [Spirochaetes bacterium]|nr:START domain-containing protein [Spirochaetota bacterium]
MDRTALRTIIPAIMGLMLSSAVSLYADDWQLKKNSRGVRVYTRAVAGSRSLEFRAVTEVESSMAGVLKLMEDIESYPKWFPNMKEVKLIKILNPHEVVLYQMMNVPFPAHDRDSYFKVTARRDLASGAAILLLSSMWEYGPEIKNVVRVKSINGSWTFLPSKDRDAVTVTYNLHTEPGGQLPAWMANAAVVKRPFTILVKMKEMLKDPRYRDARTSELRLFAPLIVYNR